MDKVLVIIVTFNSIKWIERCLGSIKASTLETDVFIVDNGSKDGTQSFIRQHFPQVIFSQSKENVGFGKANNMGMRYALQNDYNYVYLLNHDAWVFPETFKTLIDISKRYPEYAIISPMQMQANMKHMDKNFCNVIVNNLDFVNDAYMGNLKDIYPIQSVMAAHWLIPIVTLKKIGFFSPSFPHYGEDDNYCNRVFFHGMCVGIVPNALAVHDREGRKNSRDKDIYLRNIWNIGILSRVYNRSSHPFYECLKETLRTCRELKTCKCLMDYFRLVCRRKVYLENFEKSKCYGAFIEG